jgi:pilus assembly protein Flp/PilA
VSELLEDGPPQQTPTHQQESYMKNLFNRFVREEQGQDLIEYALLAGLISLASIVGITAVGTALSNKFTTVGTSVAGAGT